MHSEATSFIENEKLLLRATFRNNVQNHRHVYKKNDAVLLISPMQPYYNDPDKFKVIIQLINKSQFKGCQIIVGDTNYHHTLQINHMNPNEAYSLANEMGLRWVNENRDIFSSLEMPFTISRWNEWVQHPRYQYHRNKLNEIFAADLIFKERFMETAIEFVERNQVAFQICANNHKRAIECCLEYLKEESAIIMPLWAELKYPFIIYPTKMLKAIEETYNKLVLPNSNYRVKPHWLSLRFSSATRCHTSKI